MVIKYDIEIDTAAISSNIDRITNQIFKLLPSREEGGDWEAPLQNLIVEVGGLNRLLENQNDLFQLLCKLEALLTLKGEENFLLFRKTIFECLGLCNSLKKAVN